MTDVPSTIRMLDAYGNLPGRVVLACQLRPGPPGHARHGCTRYNDRRRHFRNPDRGGAVGNCDVATDHNITCGDEPTNHSIADGDEPTDRQSCADADSGASTHTGPDTNVCPDTSRDADRPGGDARATYPCAAYGHSRG